MLSPRKILPSFLRDRSRGSAPASSSFRRLTFTSLGLHLAFLLTAFTATARAAGPRQTGSSPSPPASGSSAGDAPSTANAGEEASSQPPPAPAPTDPEPGRTNRTSLNLLGQVDSSSGEGRRNENVQVDLIDNNVLKEINTRMGATATLVPVFEVDQTYFGAEFGVDPKRAPQLTPGRGSGVHGTLYESHTNSIFSARSFFQVGNVQPARENDYGFSIASPLWRRAFLSLNGSQQKVRGSVNGNVLVPRPDERTPLATDPETRALVERLFASYPAELPNRTDINERALNTNSPQHIDGNSIGAQLTQPLNGRDQLIARYQYTSQTVDAFQLVAGQNPDTTTRSHDARLTWNRVWSPATVLDLTLGFRRVGSLLVPEENAFRYIIMMGEVFESLGPGSHIPIDRAANDFRYAAQIQHVQTRHRWTAGVDLIRHQVNGSESNSHRGLFLFRNDFGRDAISNVRLGTPSQHNVSIGNVHRGFRNWDMRYYVGGNWRAGRDLTVDWGFRFEVATSPYEVNALSAIPYDCDCNNFAPRLGLAYRLKDSWGVLRVAYGTHYGELFGVTYGQSRFNAPGNLRLVISQPDFANPLGKLRPEDLLPGSRSLLFDLPEDLVTPYSHQYNFTWEVEPASNWRLSLGYVGSRSVKLLNTWFTNRGLPMPGIDTITATIDQRRADQRYFDIRRTTNSSRGYFDAAKVSLLAPRVHGFTMEASYWFGKSIDLGSDYNNTASGADSREARSQSELEVFSDLKGLSSFDQRHAALWRLTYRTPSLASARGWMRQAFGSWELFTVVLLKSGTPFTLSSGSDGPGFGNVDGAGGDRPNLLDPSVLGRSVDHPDQSTEQLPASAFGFIRPGELAGSIGRNTFHKDGIRNVNAAVSRRWRLGGEKALTFRAESLNFFNTPQFAEPGKELTNPNFGVITNTLNEGRTFRLRLQLGF